MGKVVLAYSGGLETTVAIHWLKHHRHLKVLALAVNLGQGRDLDVAAERALSAGADAAHVFDLRRNFLRKFCWKSLRAGARYEQSYLLSAALSRPLIATEMVRLAHDEGANSFAHGCTPRGNDQFRIECSVAALDPELKVMAPLRDWKMSSRIEVIEYARKHRIDVDPSTDQYTRDVNLWGARTSGGDLADTTRPTSESAYILTSRPEDGPDKPENVVITFVKGEPAAIDGERMGPIELMEELNRLGAQHGIGRLDTIENNLMGFKNRELYEAPGATVLHTAHSALERFVLDKDTLNIKRTLALTYADLIYEGRWFSTLRESLDAFVHCTQEFVSGEITVALFKGSCTATSGHSEFSTYDREQEMFGHQSDALSGHAADGMLEVARLQQVIRAFKQRPRL